MRAMTVANENTRSTNRFFMYNWFKDMMKPFEFMQIVVLQENFQSLATSAEIHWELKFSPLKITNDEIIVSSE